MTAIELADFVTLESVPEGQLQIKYGDVPIHVEIEGTPGQPIIVCFHGAKLKKVNLPWFVGTRMVEGLEATRLSISDPSLQLDPELGLSWYVGNHRQPRLQAVLDEIVRKYADSWRADNIIFFGGSGGGFAAMRAAFSNPGSYAVVFNPQTDIERFHRGHIDRFYHYCWNDDREAVPEYVVSSVVEQYSNGPFKSTLLYIQNNTDILHTTRHLPQFLQATAGNGKVFLALAHWNERHSPPSKEVLKSALQLAIDRAPESELRNHGFIRQ